jgi:biopolymer transport protein ExbD
MMDIVFLLILFFLLVTNFASAELPKLEPPRPSPSKARDQEKSDRIVINVIPDPDTPQYAASVRVGTQDIGPDAYGQLTEMLKIEKEKNDLVEVNLRADRHLRYDQVQTVMQAITQAGILHVNLVADKGKTKLPSVR